MRKRTLALAAPVLVAALALTACGSKSSSTGAFGGADGGASAAALEGSAAASAVASAAPAASASGMVGGMTSCELEFIQPAVDEAVKAMDPNNAMNVETLSCSEGWAVATGVLGPVDAPIDGPQGAPTSMIFEAEGQFWVPKDKQDVCGTYDSAKPDEVPADALIPADLYPVACLAG